MSGHPACRVLGLCKRGSVACCRVQSGKGIDHPAVPRVHTHHSLIVALKDSIVIIDAPIDYGQSKWVIDAAKAKEERP